jgi:hypothetical protein
MTFVDTQGGSFIKRFYRAIDKPDSLNLQAVKQVAGGAFQLEIAGSPGRKFVIEASSDFLVWTPIITNTVSFGQPGDFRGQPGDKLQQPILPRADGALGRVLPTMPTLDIKPPVRATDLIALGEIMPAGPGEGTRAHGARVQSGKAANTMSPADCVDASGYGRRCTAFADNEVGRLIEDFILQGGVTPR